MIRAINAFYDRRNDVADDIIADSGERGNITSYSSQYVPAASVKKSTSRILGEKNRVQVCECGACTCLLIISSPVD